MNQPRPWKPQYWTGNSWMVQEERAIHYGMTLDELLAYAAAQGIPGHAELSVRHEWDSLEACFTWMVPVSEEAP